MSAFDLAKSVDAARARLARAGTARRDAGRSRLSPAVLAFLRAELLGYDRPRMVDVHRRLVAACRRARLGAPSRATLYAALPRIEGHRCAVKDLPPRVRRVLFNLDDDARVPGHPLAFHCFNYGATDVVSFAAGLPWLDLFQAARPRGWRPRSLALLRAVLAAREIA